MNLKNKKVAVLGLGLEGWDLVEFLSKVDAQITVLDKKDKTELDLKKLSKDVEVISGENYLAGLDKYDVVFRSPGIYRYKKELVDAEKKGVEISSATKLFFELCPAKIIGVTGTKGKGTTSSLIYEILKTSGKDVHLAGNIGKPVLSLLPILKTSSWVILELSSFQLIDLEASPHIAVVLNITQDHLDWHKDLEEYISAKESIVSFQEADDYSVINYDYETSRKFATLSGGKIYYFGKISKAEGCYVSDGKIFLNTNTKQSVGKTKDLLLRGEHNWENISAAVCASFLAGASIESIGNVVRNFKGLEHRLELVKEIHDVKFYNDSFSTGPDTVIAAINSFSEPITIILGGFDKGLDYKNMAKEIAMHGNVMHAMVIGDIRKQIVNDLTKASFKGEIYDMGKPSMKEIVEKAAGVTPEGGVVLLSPASSSFDMFESYKDRGNQFKEAVKELEKNA